MAINDGGPAFPRVRTLGMSLRDYFAGQALAGILANTASVAGIYEKNRQQPTEALAVAVYQFADAMLAAREATHDA